MAKKKKMSDADKATAKYKAFTKIDDADPQGMMKIDTSKLGHQSYTFMDKYGDVVSGEYPYPGFSLEKKYQRQQTVEQDPKKYTRGGGSRKVNTKVD